MFVEECRCHRRHRRVIGTGYFLNLSLQMGNNQNKTPKPFLNSATTVAVQTQSPGFAASAAETASSSRHSVLSSPAAVKLDHGFNTALNLLSVSGRTTLNEEDFTKYIFAAIPCVGKFVYEYLSSLPSSENSTVPVDRLVYINRGTIILSISSVEDQTKFYAELFAHGKDTISNADMKLLLTVCQQIEWMSAGFHVSPEEISVNDFETITKSLFKDSSAVPLTDVISWSFKLCPKVTVGLHFYMCSCLIGRKDSFEVKEISNELVQTLREGQSVISLSSAWMLTYSLPPTFFQCFNSGSLMPTSNLVSVVQHNAWHSLYNSNSQGLSVSRFQHFVMDYLGPTVMFIKFDQYVYAVAIDTQWMESSRRWGGRDGMFFELQPSYRLIQSGEDIIYLNLSDRTVIKGLHIGKEARTTFLKIDDEFDKVSHYGIDFKLTAIEIWGCGGQECFDQLCRQKQWEHKEVTKHQNRKLIPDDWKNNPDRAILEMGGVTTEHSQRADI